MVMQEQHRLRVEAEARAQMESVWMAEADAVIKREEAWAQQLERQSRLRRYLLCPFRLQVAVFRLVLIIILSLAL